MKIKGVKLLSPPDAEEPKYSKSENYWYYPKSGVVYDYELKYPIGKVLFNEEGLPEKLDKDTYIIGYMIPIPLVEE